VESAVKKRWIVGGLVTITILIIGILSTRRPPESVVYNGKSLKNWALQMYAGDQLLRLEATAQFQALGSNAVPGLVSLLKTKDSFIRKGIWNAASKMPAPIKNAITTRVRPPDAARIRSTAARSFAVIGLDAQGVVPALAHLLWKDESQGRLEEALALGAIGGYAVTDLIKAAESKDSNLRYASACGLGNVRSCDNALVFALLKLGGDTNAGIAVPAGSGLSKLGTNALPALKMALESRELELRRQSTRALGTIGAPRDEIVPLLLKMSNDKEPLCRVQAIQTLGTSVVPNPVMVSGLVGALNDPATEVRVAAIRGLQQGHRMAARAVPDLVRCLDDGSPVVRESAAQALGAFGTPAKSALPRLIQAADEEDAKVRAAATAAIAKIDALEAPN